MKAIADRQPGPGSAPGPVWTDEVISRERGRIEAELAPRYQVQAFVNAGAFASVWRATDTQTSRVVAVKHLRRIARASRDFYAELRSLFLLEHPNIVRWLNLVDASSESRYLILEFCPGGSLQQFLVECRRQNRLLSEAQVAHLVCQIAQGLQRAHQQGIVHRDLKPENVLFGVCGEERLHDLAALKVADFGLARPRLQTPHEAPSLTGTPAYMAPEQFAGDFNPSTDFYALGVIAYEALHGHRPFQGGHQTLARGHCYGKPELRADLSERWRGLLLGLLHKTPASRPAPEVVINALRGITEPSRRIERRTLGLEARSVTYRAGRDGPGEFLFPTDAGIVRTSEDGKPLAPLLIDRLQSIACDGGGGLWLVRDRELWHQPYRESVRLVQNLAGPCRGITASSRPPAGAAEITLVDSHRITRIHATQPEVTQWVRDLKPLILTPAVPLSGGQTAVACEAADPMLIILNADGTTAKTYRLPGRVVQLVGDGAEALAVLVRRRDESRAYSIATGRDAIRHLACPAPPRLIGFDRSGQLLVVTQEELLGWTADGQIAYRVPTGATSEPLAFASARTTAILLHQSSGHQFLLVPPQQ